MSRQPGAITAGVPVRAAASSRCRPGGHHAADELVGPLRRGHVQHAGDLPRLDQALHRLAAGARSHGRPAPRSPAASSDRAGASTHGVVLPNIDAAMSRHVVDSSGTRRGSTMPQTAAAARANTPRLIRFNPLMSTMAGIITMSLTPTKPAHVAAGQRGHHHLGNAERQGAHRRGANRRAGAAAHGDDGVDAPFGEQSNDDFAC